MSSNKDLAAWLKEKGRGIAWLTRELGLTYQNVWGKVHNRSPITEGFIVRCFERIPDLPPDIFEQHGYVKDGDCLIKRIPLIGPPE